MEREIMERISEEEKLEEQKKIDRQKNARLEVARQLELEKSIGFNSYFLHFGEFYKNRGEFLKFLGFPKLFQHFYRCINFGQKKSIFEKLF